MSRVPSPLVKRLSLLGSVLSVLLLLGGLAAGWFYSRIRASLPQLDGTAPLAGLSAPVTVARDALGVPTVRAENRRDVARAVGWLHAQDRFFQMDLMRRSSAGELAEIFGERALPRDRAIRMHGFRQLAELVIARLPPHERAIVDAYAAGVNAGLGALPERPFEYVVLRTTPQPWRPEDSILVVCAMTIDLQDETGRYERTLMTLRDQLGPEGLAFFAPLTAPDDAALDGSTAPLPPIPGPGTIDLRTRQAAAIAPLPVVGGASFPFPPRDPEAVPGSNAFALSGRHTASGAAMLANDMHLDHGVPNIWYRASFEFAGRKITGVTLPGTPVVVAGSNGRVAWGFTNAYADTGDLVVVEIAPGLANWYLAPGAADALKMETRQEVIRIKGANPVTEEYSWTIWGPIVGADEKGRPLAFRWTAHDAVTTNLRLIEMEDVANVTEGVAVAHRAGIPAQNILLADSEGNIAWTIAGALPQRKGHDGRLPVTWRFGDRRWDGFLPSDEVPVITTVPSGLPSAGPAKEGRLWSANQRHVGGAALAKIGDGGYGRPNRAAQIRDDLAPLERALPRDLLAVQLDDRALFLAPWHKLLMDTLGPAAIAQKPSRAALRAVAEKWEGHASVEAVSYRLVHDFRTAVYGRVFPPIFASCREAWPAFSSGQLHLEPALWTMLRERPAHLLNPAFSTWDDLLVAAADDVIAALDQQGVALAHASWGRRNTARIRHPFSLTLPGFLAGWLSLPADPLPGDSDMPRVQSPGHGASERLVVSPGREAEGIFHMPGGQSGHPLSPFFRAGHEAWVHGRATPFLPGKTEHTLALRP